MNAGILPLTNEAKTHTGLNILPISLPDSSGIVQCGIPDLHSSRCENLIRYQDVYAAIPGFFLPDAGWAYHPIHPVHVGDGDNPVRDQVHGLRNARIIS